MKTNKTVSKTILGMGVALALATSVTVRANETMKPMKGGEHQMMRETQTPKCCQAKCCQAMKEQKEKMTADMKAQDAELTEQVAAMNNAPVDKKTDLMAAVVTHMVEQQTAMNARKAKMEEEMMRHMMQHMQMGKKSMDHCSMMRGMDEKSECHHKEHHGEQN